MKGILWISILPIKQFDRTYIMHMEFCSLMMTMQQKTQTGECCWLPLTHAPWRICISHSLRHGLVCNNKNAKNSRNVLIVWFVFWLTILPSVAALKSHWHYCTFNSKMSTLGLTSMSWCNASCYSFFLKSFKSCGEGEDYHWITT